MADPIYDEEKKPASPEPEDLKDQEQSAEDDPYRQLQDAWDEAKAADETAGRSFYKQAPGEPRRTAAGLLKKKKTWLIAGGSIGIIGLLLGAIFGFLNVFKWDHIMSNIEQRAFTRWNAAADRRSDSWIREYIKVRLTMYAEADGKFDIEKSHYFKAKLDTDHPATDWIRRMYAGRLEADLAKNHGVIFASRSAGKDLHFVVLEVNGQQTAGLEAKDFAKPAALTAALNDPLSNDIKRKIDINLSEPGGNKAARKAIKQQTQNENILKRRFVRKAIKNETGVKNWRFFEKTRDKYDAKKAAIRNKIILALTPDDTRVGMLIRCVFGIELCRGSTDHNDPGRRAGGTIATNDNPDTDKNISSDEVDDCPTSKAGKCLDKPDPNGNPDDWKTKRETGKTKPTDPDKLVSVEVENTANAIKKVMAGTAKAANVVGWIGIIDMLAKFSKNLQTHALSKLVSAAKAAQAMALFQTYMTARDQIRSGEVNSQEVNDFMRLVGKGANSEGWLEVVEGKGDASQLVAEQGRMVDNPKDGGKIDYCSDDYQEQMLADEKLSSQGHTFLCPSKQVGGKTNALIFEDFYNNTLGKLIGPIADGYLALKSKSGLVGKIIFGAINWASKLIGTVMDGFMRAVGMKDDFEAAMTHVIQRLGNFLGAGPIINKEGSVPPGEYINWGIQGGALSGEATVRENGGHLTNDENRQEAKKTMLAYEQAKNEQLSVFEKYLSLSNHNSPAAKGAFAVASIDSSSPGKVMASIGSVFKNFFSVLTLPFDKSANAATQIDGYTASAFAGIPTYDIPKQCYDLPPFIRSADKLTEGTNVRQVFANPWAYKYFDVKTQEEKPIDADEIEVSPDNLAKLNEWETQTNSDVFWELIYKIIVEDGHIGDADSRVNYIAENIYNCNLFDNSIRGGLGALYGYTADHGLEEPSVDDENILSGEAPAQIPPELWDIFSMAAAKYNISPYALAAIYGYGEHCTGSGSCANSQVRWPTELIQTATSSKGAQGPFQFMPSTWDNGKGGGYKEDCDSDGQADINNLIDSACAAAHYLAANGAEGIFDAEPGKNEASLKKAFYAYNHANWYANRVYAGYKKLLASALTIAGNRPTTTATATIDFANLFEDSTSVACAFQDKGVRDIGTHDGYRSGNPVKVRLCALPNLGSDSDASTNGNKFYVNDSNGQAIVNSRISGAAYELVEAAKKAGRLSKGAGSAFRTMAHQQYLCSQNEGCRTGTSYKWVAKPGTSNHQMGIAIDFYINNLGIDKDSCQYVGGRCTAKDFTDWQWLEANAARFGFKQYVNEFWHWSPDGS